MEAQIIQGVRQNETFIEEQCFISEILNDERDADLSIAKARVEPGITTHWHLLINTVERYYLLQGLGFVELGNLVKKQVQPGDLVIIPANCPQRITNLGSDQLIFLAICTPRFQIKNYQNLEPSVPS